MASILNSKAMLVSLNMSFPSGKKRDAKVSDEVAANYDVEKSVGGYDKKILPKFAELEMVQKKAAFVRVEFYKLTIPYISHGAQLLPSMKYFDFISWYQQRKSEWDGLVEVANLAYPAAYENSKLSLKGMWNPDDYPDPANFKSLFAMQLHVAPVPEVGNAFNHLVTDIAQDAEARMKESMEQVEKVAVNDVVNKMLTTVGHLVKRLSDPDGKFKDSTVDKIGELMAEIPAWNITDDPKITELSEEIKTKLGLYHPETLRNDKQERAKAVTEANAILEKLQGCFR